MIGGGISRRSPVSSPLIRRASISLIIKVIGTPRSVDPACLGITTCGGGTGELVGLKGVTDSEDAPVVCNGGSSVGLSTLIKGRESVK